MKQLILWLLRMRLRLKKGQHFRFTNQKSKVNYYYIDSTGIIKVNPYYTRLSHVNLNYLLSDECKIIKINR